MVINPIFKLWQIIWDLGSQHCNHVFSKISQTPSKIFFCNNSRDRATLETFVFIFEVKKKWNFIAQFSTFLSFFHCLNIFLLFTPKSYIFSCDFYLPCFYSSCIHLIAHPYSENSRWMYPQSIVRRDMHEISSGYFLSHKIWHDKVSWKKTTSKIMGNWYKRRPNEAVEWIYIKYLCTINLLHLSFEFLYTFIYYYLDADKCMVVYENQMENTNGDWMTP